MKYLYIILLSINKEKTLYFNKEWIKMKGMVIFFVIIWGIL